MIAENEQLRRRASHPTSPSETRAKDGANTEKVAEAPTTDLQTQVPEVTSSPWFVDIAVPHTPILIAEASDSAFATRFRQAMSASEQNHFPRVNYPAEDQLRALRSRNCEWPSLPQARLLVNAALRGLGYWHHLVRRSVILQELEQTARRPDALGSLHASRLWALFAIGQMYSTRTSASSGDFPGLRYFTKATRILDDISERPTIEMVETGLLLVCLV